MSDKKFARSVSDKLRKLILNANDKKIVSETTIVEERKVDALELKVPNSTPNFASPRSNCSPRTESSPRSDSSPRTESSPRTDSSPRNYFSDDASADCFTPRDSDNDSDSPRENIIASSCSAHIIRSKSPAPLDAYPVNITTGAERRNLNINEETMKKLKHENPAKYLRLLKETEKCKIQNTNPSLLITPYIKNISVDMPYKISRITPFQILSGIRLFIEKGSTIIINNIENRIEPQELNPQVEFYVIQMVLRKLHDAMGLYRKRYIGSAISKERVNQFLAYAQTTATLNHISHQQLVEYVTMVPCFKIIQTLALDNWHKVLNLITTNFHILFTESDKIETEFIDFNITVEPEKIIVQQNRILGVYRQNILQLRINVSFTVKTDRISKAISSDWISSISLSRISKGDNPDINIGKFIESLRK